MRLIEGGTVSFIDLLGKSYFIIGRNETCDIQLNNVSVSRQHTVIQHRGGGSLQGADECYIFDLNSTSGTYLNGQQLIPATYYALQPGDIIHFGNSPEFTLCGGAQNFQPPLSNSFEKRSFIFSLFFFLYLFRIFLYPFTQWNIHVPLPW